MIISSKRQEGKKMMYDGRFFRPGGMFGHEFYGGFYFMMTGVLVLALIIIAVVLWKRRKHPEFINSSALNVLKENFAKGLITEEEYLSRKNVLSRK